MSTPIAGLPDGEPALDNGGAVDREEFYIEHFTVFTPSDSERVTSPGKEGEEEGADALYAEGVTQHSPGLPPLLAATLGRSSE